MSSWLTERDVRDTRGGMTRLQGVTLNVAFLNDIKQGTKKPEELIRDIRALLVNQLSLDSAALVNQMHALRDELETYFALEEFYGYFKSAHLIQPTVSRRAESLQTQHEQIYLEICSIIDLAEGLLYREIELRPTLPILVSRFSTFTQTFLQHEQEEFDLMMQLCNQEIGVGD
ncbi:MAG: hypothetical protein P8J33_08325 [Pirellulaceae bacterium]|nr:hypothetical protein [Pirellulaceae bacterium]